MTTERKARLLSGIVSYNLSRDSRHKLQQVSRSKWMYVLRPVSVSLSPCLSANSIG